MDLSRGVSLLWVGGTGLSQKHDFAQPTDGVPSTPLPKTLSVLMSPLLPNSLLETHGDTSVKV